MGYIDQVADWLETVEPFPSLPHLYRVTAPLDALGCIVAISSGLHQRKLRETAIQSWEDDGGYVS